MRKANMTIKRTTNLIAIIAVMAATMVGVNGCGPKKVAPVDPAIAIQGTYAGKYFITHDAGTNDEHVEQGGVRVSLWNGRYDMRPIVKNLPPAGKGTYKVDSGKVEFVNTSMHTADFDWTLILRGWFEYTLEGSQLTMTQNETSRGRYHRLELTRQEEDD